MHWTKITQIYNQQRCQIQWIIHAYLKKEVADAETDHDAKEQVEFEAEPPKQVQEDAPDQPIQEEEQQIPNDVVVPQQLQQYSLIRDREKEANKTTTEM